ncbi:MAG: hypothetical protein ACWA5T_07245 [Parvularcula sp.]
MPAQENNELLDTLVREALKQVELEFPDAPPSKIQEILRAQLADQDPGAVGAAIDRLLAGNGPPD